MNAKIYVKDYLARRAALYARYARPAYTVALLLQIAEETQGAHVALLEEYPPGTFHEERNNMREVSEHALLCASYLEEHKLTEVRFVGPFGVLPFTRGSRVRIQAGARVFSTAPKIGREGILTQRAQVVKLHDAGTGYASTLQGMEEVHAPRVTWAGTGGYWRWTDANNVWLAAE